MARIQSLLDQYARYQRKKSGQTGVGISQKELLEELKADTKAWAEAPNEKIKEKEKKEEKNDDEHSLFSGKVSAILWKNGTYRKNTYHGMKMESRDKDFEFDNKGNLKKSFLETAYAEYPGAADIFAKYYGYSAMACNFNEEAEFKGDEKQVEKNSNKTKTGGSGQQTAGCSMPYKWNAHHMIPGSAFYKQLKSDGGVDSVFTEDQYILLLMSEYDVNNGHNMIPLPDAGQDFFQPVHKMLLHPSDHRKYTDMVMKKMKVVSDGLKDLASEANEPHPEISVEIAGELEDIETDLWRFLVSLGTKSVTAKVTKKRARLAPDEKEVLGDSGEFGSLK